ncbi:hypothetical protein MKW98_010009 [Papaver atlanticum]|uniref:Peroxidase n=1 Tax=Papaver atlanticum TaxID=357466 RepID=A0AAD4RXB3_9MAGN|nr:hypothetical protein MKW98_010009 [Papaver atlanticum]
MVMRRDFYSILFIVVVSLVIATVSIVDGAVTVQPTAGLRRKFYKLNGQCPDVEEYIKHQVKLHWMKDRSITAKLLRLTYSDCFVSGCDGSVLLDGPDSERTARQNVALGGFVVIDRIKYVIEQRCPGVVSCADILQLATRDAVHLAGAPSYPLKTGRRDGLVSNRAAVDLPSPSISWEDSLAYFRSKGLDVMDMTTLLGAHAMGSTRCSVIANRLYNFNNTRKPDPNMDISLVNDMRKICPERRKWGEADKFIPLNPENTKYRFDNNYYTRVLNKKTILGVDQQLLFGSDTKQISELFAAGAVGFEDWRRAWALSMNRMGSIGVLTVNQGQIRKHCRFINK